MRHTYNSTHSNPTPLAGLQTLAKSDVFRKIDRSVPASVLRLRRVTVAMWIASEDARALKYALRERECARDWEVFMNTHLTPNT